MPRASYTPAIVRKVKSASGKMLVRARLKWLNKQEEKNKLVEKKLRFPAALVKAVWHQTIEETGKRYGFNALVVSAL